MRATERRDRPGWGEVALAIGLVAAAALARAAPGRKAPERPGIGRLVRTAVERWIDDRGPKMAAALAYYTAFAVAPLLLIAISVAGLLFGQEAARGEVERQLGSLIGPHGAAAVQDILSRLWHPKAGLAAAAAGVVAVLIASTGVFVELQDSFDQIWRVRKKPGRGILGTLKDRVLSFSIVVGTGFLLLVSLLASAALQALSGTLRAWAGTGAVIEVLNFLVSFGLISLLFAAIFRYLPDARTRWKDAWVGGLLTAFLFNVGKTLIGLYLGRSAIASTYGAAGSFVVFLVWVNYSAQIVFLGAEFTKTWADLRGAPPRPLADAEEVECAPLSARR
ncbi:MAG TPA: YihY/virulence factor BrkB family protein [Planctomycetota bacterium]